MFRKINLLKLLVPLLFGLSCSVLAKDYRYTNYDAPDFYDGGRESFLLDTSAKQITSADSADDVIICDEKSDLVCFHNSAVSFYVPKRDVSINEKWTQGEIEFRVLRQECLELLGNAQKVWVIEAKRADRIDYFYYSGRDGLLAIKHVYQDGQVQFFVSSAQTGFPR